jgi:hypothetical protein
MQRQDDYLGGLSQPDADALISAIRPTLRFRHL